MGVAGSSGTMGVTGSSGTMGVAGSSGTTGSKVSSTSGSTMLSDADASLGPADGGSDCMSGNGRTGSPVYIDYDATFPFGGLDLSKACPAWVTNLGPLPADAVPRTDAIVIIPVGVAGPGAGGTIIDGGGDTESHIIVGSPNPTCVAPLGDPAKTCSATTLMISIDTTSFTFLGGDFPGPGIRFDISDRNDCGCSTGGGSSSTGWSSICPGYLEIVNVGDSTIDFRLAALENFGRAEFNGYYRAARCTSVP
jgi:hypothetical protein